MYIPSVKSTVYTDGNILSVYTDGITDGMIPSVYTDGNILSVYTDGITDGMIPSVYTDRF
jgi:hypothetical protein